MHTHAVPLYGVRARAWMVVGVVVGAVILSLILTTTVYAAHAWKAGKKAKVTTEHGFEPDESDEGGTGDNHGGDPSRMRGRGMDPRMMRGEEGEGPDPEEMEARMQQQMKQQMYRGIKQGMKGMKTGVTQMNKMVAKLKKQGLELPQEVTEALAKATTLVTQVESWKSAADVPDDFEDQIGDMQDVGEILQEWGPKMGQFMEVIGRLKGADKAMKQVTRELARVEKLALKVGKKLDIDLSDKVTALKTIATELQTLLDTAKAEKDVDAKLDAINEFFDRMDEAGDEAKDTIELIEGLGNLQRYVKNIAGRVKQYDATVKRLKRQKVDVGAIESTLAELKKKVTEIQGAVKAKADLETIKGHFDELEDLQGQLDEAIEEATPPEPERRASGGQQYDFSGLKNLVPGGRPSGSPSEDDEDEDEE